MPLLPLPWQKPTGPPSAHIQYSDLMAGEFERRVVVTKNDSPEGEPPWWRLHFGVMVNVSLCLTDETVKKLVAEIARMEEK